MKKCKFLAMAMVIMTPAFYFSSCLEDDFDSLGSSYTQEKDSPVLTDYPIPPVKPASGPYGKSYAEWTKEWWKYVMSFDCNTNPLNYPVLSYSIDQRGPVIFLVGSKNGIASRDIEMSGNKAILVPVINTISSFPCVDPSLAPAPGQNLEQYLKSANNQLMDQDTNMKALLDGKPIRITNENRIDTDVFYFTGRKDLIYCLDACVTGQVQAAVSDGYWIMINGLTRGKHVLRIHAEILQSGIVVDANYTLHVY